MAKYKVTCYRNRGKNRSFESGVLDTFSRAYTEAQCQLRVSPAWKVITILRDSEGEDHPDNAGKFFLDKIVK